MKRNLHAMTLVIALGLSQAATADPAEPPACIEPFYRLQAHYSPHTSMQDLQFYRFATGKGSVTQESRILLWDDAEAWEQRLSLLGLAPSRMNARPFYSRSSCNYAVAVKRLDERMKTLGRKHPYLTVWAKNQMTVFENCEQSRDDFVLPSTPKETEPALQTLAAEDFAYQTASAYFYASYWPQAAASYLAIYGNPSSPYHGLAGYMAARSLMHGGQALEATRQLKTVLADPVAADVHVAAQELMDAAAYNSQDVTLLTEQLLRNATLLDMPAEDIAVSSELVTKYQQAAVDLSWFLRGPMRSLPLDWWLNDSMIGDDPRAEATRVVARSSDAIDWLQAMTSSHQFAQYGWITLYSTLAQSPEYDAVTRHAVRKWHDSGAIHWAIAAMMRAKPSDGMNEEFLRLLGDVENRIATCTARFGDREIYSTLFYNVVRLLAMDGQTDRAIMLLKRQMESPFRVTNGKAYLDLLRWLVGRGEIEKARQLDALFRSKFEPTARDGLLELRQIIATDLDDFLAQNRRNRLTDGTAAVLNLLPVDVLAQVIDSESLNFDTKAALARVAWTRAYLLRRDDLLGELTLKLRQLNRNLDLHFDRIDAASSDTVRRNLLTYIMLEAPRLGIRLNPVDSNRQSHWGDYATDLFAIDSHNPNDNNWWCRFDQVMYEQTMRRQFYELIVAPWNPWNPRFPELSDTDLAALQPIEDRVLADHPVLKLIDEKELAALAQIDSGPVYLGRRALDWANERGWFSWFASEDPLLPKTLYLAVRATRYGCNVDAKYGDVSRAAFQILHQRYPDSPWTQITPYWFGTRGEE